MDGRPDSAGAPGGPSWDSMEDDFSAGRDSEADDSFDSNGRGVAMSARWAHHPATGHAGGQRGVASLRHRLGCKSACKSMQLTLPRTPRQAVQCARWDGRFINAGEGAVSETQDKRS